MRATGAKMQLPLPIYTDFELATAQQLAGQDSSPEQKHFDWAKQLCQKWNYQRKAKQLREWI